MSISKIAWMRKAGALLLSIVMLTGSIGVSRGRFASATEASAGSSQTSMPARQNVSAAPGVYAESELDAEDGPNEFIGLANTMTTSGGRTAIVPETPYRSSSSGGTEKVIVIPVQYTDQSFVAEHDQTYWQSMMDGVNDYFRLNSNYAANVRGVSLNCTVSPIVTLPYDAAYYGEDSVGVDGDDGYYGDAYKIAADAVTTLDAMGFDFSPYASGAGSLIQHIMIIHAGSGQEQTGLSSDIWSHRWAIIGTEPVDGVYAYNYACVPEDGELGVFVHEFGHELGLPDLYDTDGGANGYSAAAGMWDVMASGSWNTVGGANSGSMPSMLSAWSRVYLGWTTPTVVSADTPLTFTNTNGLSNVYKIVPPTSSSGTEYYLVEYRRKLAYDAGLQGEGLLIWHIDQDKVTASLSGNVINATSTTLGVALEQADGKDDLYIPRNIGDAADPFPGSGSKFSFMAVPFGKPENVSGGLNYTNNLEYSYVDLQSISVSGSSASASAIVTRRAPSAPVLETADSTVFNANTQTVSWDKCSQVERYLIRYGTDASMSNYVEATLGATGSAFSYSDSTGIFSYIMSSMDTNSVYYWKIAAVNGTGTIWSDVRKLIPASLANRVPGITFSFSGVNAGRLMGATTEMEYSLDGGDTYSACAADELLTSGELASITASNNIIVRYATYGQSTTIDITVGSTPAIEYDDAANTLTGITSSMEFSTDLAVWTQYGANLPDLSGNLTIYIRNMRNGTNLESAAVSAVFTVAETPPTTSATTLETTASTSGTTASTSETTAATTGTASETTAATTTETTAPTTAPTTETTTGTTGTAGPSTESTTSATTEETTGASGSETTAATTSSTEPAAETTATTTATTATTSAETTAETQAVDAGGAGGGGGGGGSDAAADEAAGGASGAVASSGGGAASSLVPTGLEIGNAELNGAEKVGSVIRIELPATAYEPSFMVTDDVLKVLEAGSVLEVQCGPVAFSIPGSVFETDEGERVKIKAEVIANPDAAMLEPAAGLFRLADGKVIRMTAQVVSALGVEDLHAFAGRLTISIPVDVSGLSAVEIEKLGAYWYNEETAAWELVGGAYDATAGCLVFGTDHFSTYAAMVSEVTFADIVGHWAKETIEMMAAKGIAKGSGGSFSPNAQITRAQFVSLLVRTMELEATDAIPAFRSFSDVDMGKWYNTEIWIARQNQLIGSADGPNFRPDDSITREEMTVLIARALKAEVASVVVSTPEVASILARFGDSAQVAEANRESVALSVKYGIINGRTSSTFVGSGTATRAEAVTILYRLLKVEQLLNK